MNKPVSRRSFALAATGLAVANIRLARAAGLSAHDVIAQVQANLNASDIGADSFLAGDPNVMVKGIAMTAMATMDVLKKAKQSGLNLVVTYEGIYYGQAIAPPPGAAGGRGGQGRGGGRGQVTLGPDDPVYMAKKEFVEKSGMAIYRLRDQWASRKDNPLAMGLAEALGWSKYQVSGDPTSYQIPAVKFEALVSDVRKRLNTRGGIRVLGDRQASIRRVALLPGLIPIDTGLRRLPDADLLLTGESREWEVTEYAFDAVTAGQKKGFIMLGRVVSEDPGMRACSTWAKTLIKEMPVEWIGTGDPYWRSA